MQKKIKNFITQLFLEMKLAYYLASLLAYPDMSDHTELVCCYYGCLITYKNSTLYLKLLVKFCSLKNPVF